MEHRRALLWLLLLVGVCALGPLACRSEEADDRSPAAAEPSVGGAPSVLPPIRIAIMSDNKGDAPDSSPHMARAVAFIDQLDPVAIIGLGDHLMEGRGEAFIDFAKRDPLWSEKFWPNIADGENAFYGQGQWDWGSGGQLLADLAIQDRAGVTMRANGAEYYAAIPMGRGTLHLFQLHYPDQPWDPEVAFPEESRTWAMERLSSLQRGPGDVVIVGAHSAAGDWVTVLPPEQRAVVLSQADLLLSATTHSYYRLDYGDEAALCINTGSVGYSGDKNGFVSVEVLDDPLRLRVEYVSTDENAEPSRVYLKHIGGLIEELSVD